IGGVPGTPEHAPIHLLWPTVREAASPSLIRRFSLRSEYEKIAVRGGSHDCKRFSSLDRWRGARGCAGSRRCGRVHRCKGQFEFIGVEELAFSESHQVGEERQGFQEFLRFKRHPYSHPTKPHPKAAISAPL